MLRGEVPDGSTIIWEYALNESNHLNFGQSIESLAYHFDWFLELCRRRRIKVLPLIFWTRPEHLGRPENYRSCSAAGLMKPASRAWTRGSFFRTLRRIAIIRWKACSGMTCTIPLKQVSFRS